MTKDETERELMATPLFSESFFKLSKVDQCEVVDAKLRKLQQVVDHGSSAEDRERAAKKILRLVRKATRLGIYTDIESGREDTQ